MQNPPDDSVCVSHDRPTFVRWNLIIILMGFAGLNHFHRQALPSVVERVMQDCGLTATDMGSVYSAFLLGYVLFMVVGGWIADRAGGAFGLCLSGFGTAAMVAATGYSGYGASVGLAFGALLTIRGIMGVLTTPLFPSAGRIVSDWIPFQTRAWANGLVLGATTIGVSSSPIVFGALADYFGWRNAFVIAGVVTFAWSLLWAFYGRNRPHEHPLVNSAELATIGGRFRAVESPQRTGHLLRLLGNRNLILLTLTYAAVGYYEYTLFYWMKYYFHDVLKYEEQASRYFTSIVTLAMVFAMPLGGVLSDLLVRSIGYRAGRSVVPILGMLGSAVLLYLATQMQGQFAVVSLFFLAHASIGLCEAPTWVAGLEIGGEHRGTSAAIVNTGGNLGGLLAPVVTVHLAKEYGWNIGFLAASGVCLIGVALWLCVRLERPDRA